MKFKDEHAEQAALFSWAEFAQGRYPELALMFAIPNGGHRHKAVAVRMKAEGVKPGVPDICVPVPRGSWHGLYIELKTEGGSVSRAQRRWLALLSTQGYRAEVCRGWQQAQAVIEDYLTTAADAGRQQWMNPIPHEEKFAMDNQMPAASGGEIIDLPAPGQQDPVDVTHVEDLTVRIKKITTTDEGRLQVVLESEGMDNSAIGQVKDMLLLQQTCLVKVSMKPVQRDLFDA